LFTAATHGQEQKFAWHVKTKFAAPLLVGGAIMSSLLTAPIALGDDPVPPPPPGPGGQGCLANGECGGGNNLGGWGNIPGVGTGGGNVLGGWGNIPGVGSGGGGVPGAPTP
jgi:hypothetical protein